MTDILIIPSDGAYIIAPTATEALIIPDANGIPGAPGAPGPPGSGSTIIVKDEGGAAIGGSARDFINLKGAGVTATANGTGVDIDIPGGGGGGGSSNIGLFTAAATQAIPTATLVETSGYSVAGYGAAKYKYDAAVDAAYVAAHPRTSFRETGGRGFRLAISGQEIDLAVFGVVPGAAVADFAARTEAAVAEVVGDGWGTAAFRWPRGPINLERDVFLPKGCIIRGHGRTRGLSGTTLFIPAGCSGIRTTYAQDNFDTLLEDFRIEQVTRLTTSAIGNYNHNTRQFTITSGTNDYVVNQIVEIEGCDQNQTITGETYEATAGSNILAITTVSGGNPCVHNGQPISGAGIPAGATVAAWAPASITMSANATASTGPGQSLTVKMPLVTKVTNVAGAVLTVDANPSAMQDGTGVRIRHADAGIVPEAPIVVNRVDCVGMHIGRYLRGDAAGDVPVHAVNHSVFRDTRSGTVRVGIHCCGRDSNASLFDFFDVENSSEYGVRDTSLIGNLYHGGMCAFNAAIAIVGAGNKSSVVQTYMEGGSGYYGPGVGTGASAYANQGMTGGMGLGGIGESPSGPFGGYNMIDSLWCLGSAKFDFETFFNRGMWQKGSYGAFFEGGVGMPVGLTGTDKGVLLRAIAGVAQVLGMDGAGNDITLEVHGDSIDMYAQGVFIGNIVTTGLNLANGKVLKINAQQIIRGQLASLPAAATDLASAITLVNALRSGLSGGGANHGLFA